MLRSARFWIALVLAGVAGYGVRWVMDLSTSISAASLVPKARLEELTAGECPGPVDPKADVLRTVRKVLQDDRSGFEDLEFSATDRPCVLEFSIPHESFYQGRLAVRFAGSTTRLDFFSRFDGALNATDRPTFTVWLVGKEFAFEDIHSRLFKVVRAGEVKLVH